MKDSAIIEVRDVWKSYQSGELTTEVLKGITMEVAKGQFAVIFGPSGSGKTTLLNLIGALDIPTRGTISVTGQEISSFDRKDLTEFRRSKIGFVFQFYNLLPTLTSRENVEAGLEIVLSDRKKVRQRAREYLNLVGIERMEDKFPSQLSGGEQQRVAIARALAKEPEVLLADEPTGNLDSTTGEMVVTLMKKLQSELGLTFVVVTHNMAFVDYADLLVRIQDGKLIIK